MPCDFEVIAGPDGKCRFDGRNPVWKDWAALCLAIIESPKV